MSIPVFTLADLPTADIGSRLKTVQRDDLASLARTIMSDENFSQLPVTARESTIAGVVTWRSLACGEVVADTRVGDVCEPVPGRALFPLTTPVVDVLDLVFQSDFVLTCNDKDRLCGIVTASDMAKWAKHYATAYLAVEEIERHLRGALGNLDPGLLPNDLPAAPAHKSDQWTFGRYRQFLERDEVWRILPKDQLWSRIDRSEFRRRLRDANKARNRAFHFRTDGDLTAEQAAAKRADDADQLAKFARCLRIITRGHRSGPDRTRSRPTEQQYR